MEMNVSFGYDAETVFSLIDAETSRHAAFLRFQDGGSAYDALKVHTKDRPTIDGYVSDAFRTIASHFSGECLYSVEKCSSCEDAHSIGFYLPDFDQDLYDVAKDETESYVVLSATARWLMNRSFGEYAKMVATDCDASLNRLVTVLRTRKFPLDR